MKATCLFLLALFLSAASFAQPFEKMLCRSWHTYKYIQADGQVIDPLPQYAHDKITFNPDHSVISLEGTPTGMHTQKGTWSYAPATRTLSMVDKEGKITIDVKVLKLTDKQFVYEYTPPGRQKTKFYLKPVK